ncbi:MAG TPA: hypothetical protein VIL05_08955 [Thermoclostridium sp.]
MIGNDLKLTMQEWANGAIDLADVFEIKLDYSEDSVVKLDILCQILHSNMESDPENYDEEIILVSSGIMGAYLGELIIRNIGGEWEEEEGKGISVRKGVFACHPISKIYKRLKNGDQDDIEIFYKNCKARMA